MTASTVKSSKITTALDTSPRTVEPERKQAGRLLVTVDNVPTVATTSIDETGDKVLLLPISSRATLHSLTLFNDDLDSNGSPALAVDVGVHNGPDKFNDTDSSKTAYAAYAVIDADCIATAITTLQAANTTGVEILFEANNIDNIGKQLWEIAGLTSDPDRLLVLALTVTTAAGTAAAGGVALRALHTQ